MNTFDSIKRIKPYFKKYRTVLYLDLFCASLTTVADITLPLILKFLTQTAMDDPLNFTMNVVLKIALLFFVIKIIDIIAGYYMTSIGHIMGAKIETEMRRDIYSHLQTLSDSFYNEARIGQIMSRITNDLFDITEFAHHCPEEYFIGAIKIIVTFVILMSINVPMTLIIYAIIPFMFIVAAKYRKKMREAQQRQRVHIGDINSEIEDSLSGIRVVRSFTNEELEKDKFSESNNYFLGIKKSYYKNMAAFMTVTRTFDGIMHLALILTGGYFMIQGTIDPADLIVYVMYVRTMIMTVNRIVEFTEQFQKGITGIERFGEIMDIEPEIKDTPGAKDIENVSGNLEFKDVWFRYNQDLPYVIKDFNLKVSPGESVAIVGPSGSGKTTICNLIPRFYEVTEGQILLDGKDTKDITLKSLRENIGIVQQDVYLFSGSILDNIRYGREDATFEEVVEVSKMAGAYEFIQEMPDGFDTHVGERGVKLSGGQKQRISIARVFLKNPKVLILDEATSALDNESELIVQQSLERLTKGRTTLTIAHRLTTVQNSDLILVMSEEGIVERGTHEELMAKKSYYYNLYTKGGLLN